MDEQRFDDLARRFAGTGPRSRRSLLKGLVAAVVTGAAGMRAAPPAIADSEPDSDRDGNQGRGCKREGKNCNNDGQCCGGLICGDAGFCTPGCRIDGVAVPPGEHPNNTCLACVPTASTSGWTPEALGKTCDDGNACTSPDSCDGAGSCIGDVLAPVITCPANQVLNTGSGACGAVASYTASATCDGAVTCSPPSGSSFGVGGHTVTCQAGNGAGSVSCQFSITVQDDSNPDITCPGDMTVTATGPDGAVVNYSASATDNCTPVSVTCTPPSGSLFPIGNTPVTCTATDPDDGQDTCGFNVSVSCAPDCSSNSCGAPDGCGGRCFGGCLDSNPCADYTCDPIEKICVPTFMPLGTQCGNPCNIGATCDGNGTCLGGVPPVCRQNENSCYEEFGDCDVNIGCMYDQLPAGTLCDNRFDLCNASYCTADGQCRPEPVTCEIDCQQCDPSTGTCYSVREGLLCDGNTGYCRSGRCESPCEPDCPGWCYEDRGTLPNGPVEGYFCCPESARMANGACCWIGGGAGIVQNDGATCTHPRQVCSGGVICDVECCGSSDNGFAGVCPDPGQYCGDGTTLLPAGVTCTYDGDCGGWGLCAEIEVTFNGEGDPLPVPGSGVCCPYGYTSGTDVSQPIPVHHCCPPGTEPPNFGGADICCAFPQYGDSCINCDCSFKGITRCCS